MHDPRVGRFFATDPLSRKYPFYTPYSFSGNKVIAFSELEGLEEAWVIRDSKIVKAQGPTTTVANGFTNYGMALIGLHFKMHNQQSLDTFMAMWDEGEIDPTGVPKNQSYLRATQPEWEKYPEHYMGQTMAPYMFEAGKEIVEDAFVAGVLSKAKKLSKVWNFIKLGLKTGGAVSRNYAAVSNELRGIYKRIKSIEKQNTVFAHAVNDLKKFKEISFDEMRSVVGRGVKGFRLRKIRGQSIEGNATAIGRMKDLKKYDQYSNIDTWHKTGPGILPGKNQITWSQNRKWLDQRIERGDTFIMTMNPKDLPTKRIPNVPNGYFTKLEYDHLIKKNAKIIYDY